MLKKLRKMLRMETRDTRGTADGFRNYYGDGCK